MHPARRVGLQHLYRLRDSHVWRQNNQQMRMIRRPSRGQHRNPVMAPDPRKIFRKLGKHFLRDTIPPLFAAEDAVHENVWISVGHGSTVQQKEDIGLGRTSRWRWCPSLKGTRACWAGSPGTSVPGFPMSCLRHWCVLQSIWNTETSHCTTLRAAAAGPLTTRANPNLSKPR